MTTALVAALAASGCDAANETVTLVFPSEPAREAVDTLVATIVEPLERVDGEPAAFVPCERIGSFAPVGRIRLGPAASPAAAGTVLRTDRASLPLSGGFSVGFDDLPRRADNPWGLVAVVFEARGAARAPLSERGRFREQSSTLLSGCYCLRTQVGRFPDVDAQLDAAVRDACPLVGGREGEPTRARTVPLRPVVPPEFRLEPCGASVAAAPSDGVAFPGPAVCLRADPCANTSSELCFDCGLDCDELDDRSGGAIEMRVVDPSAPVSPRRQIVLTNAQGWATPDLALRDCRESFEVEAHVVGRAADVVRLRVDCVPALAELTRWDAVPLAGRVVALEGLPGGSAAPPAVALLTREVDLDRVRSRLDAYAWFGGRLVPEAETSTVFERRTAHGLVAFDARVDGPPAPRLGVAVATSSLTDRVRNVEIHVFDVGDAALAPARSGALAAPCDRCDCGSLAPCETRADCGPSDACVAGRCRTIETRPCAASEECPVFAPLCRGNVCTRGAGFGCRDPSDCREDDLCVAGFCAPREACTCELVADPSEQVVLRASDVDDDGWTDLAASVGGQRTVTFHRARAEASPDPFPDDACSCARVTPLANTFDLLELGADDRTSTPPGSPDLVTASPDGAHVRYAERVPSGGDRVTCGVASGLGEPFEVRDVRAVAARCGPGAASCPARDDLLVLGRVDLPAERDAPVVRIAYGASEDLANDPDLFFEPDRATSLFVSQPAGADRAGDPQSLETGDFNGDGADDFAVLFRDLGEVRVWLGSGAGAFTESSRARYATEAEPCIALVDFAAVDLDADGEDEIALVCDPTTAPRLLVFGEDGP